MPEKIKDKVEAMRNDFPQYSKLYPQEASNEIISHHSDPPPNACMCHIFNFHSLCKIYTVYVHYIACP